jgi:hypothetical protein
LADQITLMACSCPRGVSLQGPGSHLHLLGGSGLDPYVMPLDHLKTIAHPAHSRDSKHTISKA